MVASFCAQGPWSLPGLITEPGRSKHVTAERQWFAIYTLPQNERAVARHLDIFQIETFLPTCTSERRWKNRQRATVIEALFPTYVFARFSASERGLILRSPGVRRIVGNHKGPIALTETEIEFLRTGLRDRQVESYCEIAVGERVRIKAGQLAGLEGILVRKKNSMRFVLTLELIGQSAAVEVSAEDLEPASE